MSPLTATSSPPPAWTGLSDPTAVREGLLAELPTDLPTLWQALQPQLRPAVVVRSDHLSALLDADVFLASETLQRTGSFKFRAALSAVVHSPARHLLTASSGNFGAALACAAALHGRRCTVVMPDRSAAVKIAAVRRHGAQVDLIDTSRISRAERVAQLAAETAAQVVSPYDDPFVIAGNSTLAAELLDGRHQGDLGEPGLLVAPIGGGGLSAGLVLGRDVLGSPCPVLGAEPLLGNDAARSLRAGALLSNEREPDTLCDGARTLSLGRRNFALLRHGLAGIVEVDERQVAAAVRLLFTADNLKVEPTGALAVAALLTAPERARGHRVVCVLSGGNVDAAVYRGLLAEEEAG